MKWDCYCCFSFQCGWEFFYWVDSHLYYNTGKWKDRALHYNNKREHNCESIEVFGCFGLVGNLLSIIVLNTKDMKNNCFNNLLTALNITDRYLYKLGNKLQLNCSIKRGLQKENSSREKTVSLKKISKQHLCIYPRGTFKAHPHSSGNDHYSFTHLYMD